MLFLTFGESPLFVIYEERTFLLTIYRQAYGLMIKYKCRVP